MELRWPTLEDKDAILEMIAQNKKLDRGTYIQAKNWYTAQ